MENLAERKRLAALKAYGVLDTPNEPEFDALVRQAAEQFGTPIALVSLVDENRQWFKAKIGLGVEETPRSISFCTHALRGPDVFVVQDATKDPLFANNPLVVHDPHIRFYAGAPLKTPDGKRIGTFCVIDRKPRRAPTEDQAKVLEALAAKVMELFEARSSRARAPQKHAA